jgi:hypothetical protein
LTTGLAYDFARLSDESQELIRVAMTELNLSARAYDRILKVSRTVADLAQSDSITPDHVSEAIMQSGAVIEGLDHAAKDLSNQRPKPFASGYAVWEIHPVMKLAVNQQNPRSAMKSVGEKPPSWPPRLAGAHPGRAAILFFLDRRMLT